MKVLGVIMILLLVFVFTGLQNVRAAGADEAYQTGLNYFNGDGVTKNYAEALKWFKKAADQGNADAQYNVGLMYFKGVGVTQDDTEAFKWFKKAADQGHAKAKNMIEVDAIYN